MIIAFRPKVSAYSWILGERGLLRRAFTTLFENESFAQSKLVKSWLLNLVRAQGFSPNSTAFCQQVLGELFRFKYLSYDQLLRIAEAPFTLDEGTYRRIHDRYTEATCTEASKAARTPHGTHVLARFLGLMSGSSKRGSSSKGATFCNCVALLPNPPL